MVVMTETPLKGQVWIAREDIYLGEGGSNKDTRVRVYDSRDKPFAIVAFYRTASDRRNVIRFAKHEFFNYFYRDDTNETENKGR